MSNINIDDLVNSIEDGKNPIDTVSLPLLFSIRHALELGLKANILTLEKINDEVEKIKLGGQGAHSLEKLYDKFVEHLKTIRKKYSLNQEIDKQITTYLKEFKSLKNKLHKLDKGSYNFRYPVDRNGNYNFTWDTRENLVNIINTFYELQPFIVFTEAVLADHGIGAE